ncbi:MAG: hypothetical protein AB7I59_18120 [Geminicoccaceae bacterium]|uniref:hypothetical protein n=1 Tax=Reyranella sp. TaxID=1929291 RepID=UPI003D13D6E8
MAMNFIVGLRNAMLDSIEAFIGTSPVLKLRTGAKPTAAADPDSGTVVATINLPSDWLAAAAGGQKVKSGTWQDTDADADGIIGHFRLYDSGGNCMLQGSVTNTGGGGEMTVDNVNVNQHQQITITAWTFNAGNP